MGRNRIKVTVSEHEQKKYGISYETMDHTDQNTRKLCEEIIKRADREMGFSPDDGKILVEARKRSDGNVTLYLSKVPAEINDIRTFEGTAVLRDCDAVLDAVFLLSRFSSFPITCKLYYYAGEYYISFRISAKRKDADTLWFSLLEYGEKTSKSPEFLAEYAECISQNFLTSAV